MSLRSELDGLRDRAAGDLVIAHDYFAYSQELWQDDVAVGLLQMAASYEFHNPVTGSRLSTAHLGSLATVSIDTYLP